jgi:hypothetical protein
MTKTKSVFTVFVALAASMIILTAWGRGTAPAAASSAAKLPADGGEPGKDYMTYVKAVHKRDGVTIRKMAEVPPGISDKEFREQMEMAAAITPKDQKILAGTINKDKALLKVTGILDGKKQYGAIEMQKKGGVWKITKEDWSETEKK